VITVIGDVLTFEELQKVRDAFAGMVFVDGKATAGHRAKRVKQNLQADRAKSPQAADLEEIVLGALRRNAEFKRAALPRHIRPPLFSRYEPGMHYGRHVDDAIMGSSHRARSDLSVTLFVSDPQDYDGGELAIETPFGEQEIKLPAGAAVVYESSTLHRVVPVTRGYRLAAVTWVQSLVRDPAAREILHDLDLVRHACNRLAPDAHETDLAYKAYVNLMRMWAEL
jgi:PKHD-type hydroxylase